jgi:hypothetical protein
VKTLRAGTGDDQNSLTDDRLRNDLLPGQSAPPLPPLQVVVEDTGAGVRITVVNDGPLGRLNGAVRYDAYHADDVDTSTAVGKKAGFARAVCVAPSIPATDVAHTQSSAEYSDSKYSAGFWYVCGVGADGGRSEPSEPAQVTRGAIDKTIPGDVTHLQISESGRVSNGTVFSELSVTCDPPAATSNLGGVQMYLKDYLSLGDIQEGYFHQWRGSGGINFDPLYPIPRRRAAISLTATGASNSFTAAGGLLAIAKTGELLEILGEQLSITGVTDTAISTLTAWPKANITTDDFVIIGKPRIFIVSVSKAGTRRDDIENAPFVDVLMDGQLSPPNQPATIYISNAGVAVLIEWDQVAGSTISGYNVYRSDGSSLDTGMVQSPPQPSAGTLFLGEVQQNPSIITGSTYARMQFPDSKFSLYDLEANSAFIWYVTTKNTRGDESSANYSIGNCRSQVTGEIDPNQTGRNPGKNYLYNAAMAGTANNQVLATDTSQDNFMGTDASNLPGRTYVAGQTNGTGRLRGYTRWESSDAGGGAAGTVKFQNGDEIHIPPPGAGKVWYVLQEIGAWEESSGNAFKKVGKGEVYTLSVYVNHSGTSPDGSFVLYVEQYDNNTFKAESKRRFRDTNSVITTVSSALSVDVASITATSTRYQAAFQLDSSVSPTRQIRINFAWFDGTVGEIVVRRAMLNAGEIAGQWTADMGDTNISLPVPATPIDPIGDQRVIRDGDVRLSPP